MTKDEFQKAVDDAITDCIRNDCAFGSYAHKVTDAVWPVLEAAEKEITKLRIALAEKVTSEATLRDLNVENNFINATFEGDAIQLMLDALADQFAESGASNYIEMQFHSKAGPFLFTLQRVDGKTPHQLLAEAEEERDALRAKIDSMENMKAALQQHHNNAMGEGFDPSHPLTKLRVSAYQQTNLYANTIASLEKST
jgi:hypothetical protein